MRNKKRYIIGLLSLALLVVAVLIISSPSEVPLQGSLRQADGSTAEDGYYDLRVVGYDQTSGQQTISQDFTDVLITDGSYNLPLTLPRFSQTGNSYLQICRSSFPSLTEDGIQSSTPDGGCVEPVKNQQTFTYAECPQSISFDRSQGIAGLLGSPSASLFGECVYSASASDTGNQIPLAPSDATSPSVVAIQGEKGDKGDSGIGIDGVTGPAGPQGERGEPGQDGEDGQDGADGVNGQNGLNGANGVNGTDGADGAAGPQGPAGDPATDDQTLAYVGGTQVLSIAGGNSVNLSNLLDNTDQLADLSCGVGEVAQWNGSAWVCAAVGVDTDDQTLNLAGTDLSIDSGNTVSLASFLDNTDVLASLSCASNQIARWSGAAWVCSADIDTVLDEATVDAYTANNGYLSSEVDAVIGNEVLNATSNKGLVRTGAGTAGDPFTLGLINCANNEILKYNNGTSAWGCAADNDTDTDTTYTAGTGITIVGTVISSTLGTSIDDGEVSDTITIGAGGSVDDGALSGNVSLLGGSIDSSEITNGTIAFADIAANGCNSGEIIEFNGSAWICGTDGDTTYTAGAGISFLGNVISSTLGASVDSTEIDADTIVAGDIATGAIQSTEILDGTILFADIAQNGCSNDQVIKYNGSAWICGTDLDSVLDEATVDAYVANNGYLTSEVDGSTTNELQNVFNTIDTDNGTDPVADGTSDTLTLASGSGVTITGNGATDTVTIAAILGTSIDSSEITDATIAFADLGSNSCNSGEIIKFNGSAWFCGTDSDTDTTLNEAQVEAFIFDGDNSGTISSGTLALDSLSYTGTLDDANVNDALTISAAGSVADGALSANVSLLGASIDSTEITNGTILFADLNANGCNSGEIMEYNGSAWSCGTDGDTTYSAGTGISFAGTVISSTLGTAIDSSEITDATIAFADLGANACNNGEIIKFNGSTWYCGADNDTDTTLNEAQVEAFIFDADNVGTLSSGTLALDSLSYTGTIDDANVNDALTISAAASVADGALSSNVSLLGATIESTEITNGTILFADVNANGCNSGEVMEYNGSAWSCGVDADTTYSAGTGISFAGTVISSTLGTAIDSSEITDATIAFADLGANSCNNGEIIKFNGSTWYCGADIDTDTTLNEGQVEAFIFDADNTGTLSSGTLALDSLSYTGTIDDVNVNDALTISATGSVADGALSANVSLLGASIESTEITNGTILFADLNANSCNSGEVMEYNGSAWSCGVDADTTYSAGTGISFAGTVISSTLGTAIDSSEITDGTIAFADLGANSCNNGEIVKFNGSAWYCGTDIDTDTTLTEGQVEAFIFDADNAGTISSGTLALDSLSYTGTLDDANVNDALTISAAGSVDDGALSANVSLLGASIESTEIANGTILFADLNANGCNSGEVMEYNGSAWSCGVDADTTYTAGTGISFAGTVISSTLGTAIDSSEITDATIAFADLGANSCNSGEIVKFNGSAWYCGTDVDTDTTLTEGQVEAFIFDADNSGTISSGTLALDSLSYTGTLDDANVNDALTVSAAGSVADGALSANVSLLGASIESTEITNGTILFADLNDNGCNSGEVMEYNGSAWSCGVDADTTYSAGTGISFAGTVISSTLGTAVDSSEITDATIAFADLGANSCNSGEIIKFNGSAWYCGTDIDTDTTLNEGQVEAFIFDADNLGTISSGTLALDSLSYTGTIDDANVNDALTISATGSVADGALSANVSLLGASIDSTEITNGTILFADINANSCNSGEIMEYNGSAWSCGVDGDTTYSAGTGISFAGTVISSTLGTAIDSSEITDATIAFADMASNSCGTGTVIEYNGSAWICGTDDVDDADASPTNELQNLFSTIDAPAGTDPVADSQTDTLSLAAGSNISITGDSSTDTITIAASFSETDGTIGNEVLNATSNKGLVRAGAGTVGDPFTLGLINCADNEILKYDNDTSTWGCAADVDTDTDTTYSAGTGIGIVGTIISSTLGTSIDDTEVNDNITIGATGSVNDAALSANVSLLGSSIDSSEITNGTIAFADIASNSCNPGEIMEYNGSAWICGVDGDTTYSAGAGISFAGTVISSTLGTSISSAEIDADTIVAGDIATSAVETTEILDGTILFADLGQNGCGNNEIIKWNGSAWFCGTDVDTTLNEAQVDSYVSNNGYLTSEVDGSTTNELQNLFSTIDVDNGTDPVADAQTDTLTLSSGTGVTITGDGTTDTITVAAVLGTSIDSTEITNGTIAFADIASNSCGTDDIFKFNGSAWYCGADADTDTTLNEAQVEAFIFDADNSGTISSGTFALDSLSYTGTLDDANVNDALTISSSGSVADGALSANVSLLGAAIDSTEITNGTILFADIASNSCNPGEVIEYNGSAWICGTDTDTTYSAGTGISFAGTVISSTLGVAIDSAEITNDTIVTGDIFDGTILNADLANSAVTVTAGSGLTTGGSVSLGASVTLDIGAGNGITVNANDIAVRAAASADALSATTSSGSGLEVLATGVGLLQGCANNELLKWNETTDVWACGTIAAGSITADTLNFTEFSDTLSLDATTTLSLGANNFTANLDSTGDLAIQFAGNTVFQILDTGAVTLGSILSDQAIGIDNGTGTINIATDGDANTTNIGTGTAADTVTIGDANANVALTDAQWSITGAGAATVATFAGAGLTDCDGSDDALKWDSTTSQFVCGTNRGTFHNSLNGNYTNITAGFTDVDNDADATDELGFAIGANETWVFETWMQYNSPAAADSQWQVIGPAGATCDIQYIDLENANTIANLGCGASSGNQATVAADDTTLMIGTITTGATAGTVMNQFRQNTVSGTSTIYIGSYITAYRISGADYAETYFTNDHELEAGMIAEMTGDGMSQVKRASSSYSDRQIGIVSTSPGKVIGAADGTGRPVPIAMSGRVPVKISTENGLPKAGDMITASPTKPGYAMRATKSGNIVGQLMVNAVDNGDGTATGYVFVRNGYWQAPLSLDLGTILDTQITVNDANVAKSAEELKLSEAFGGQFDSLNQAVIDEILNGFTIQQDQIDSLEQRLGVLESGMAVSDASVVQLVTQADGKLTIVGDTTFTGSIWFQGATTFASNAAGEIVLEAGATEGQATFNPAYSDIPYVTASPQDFVSGSWRVTNVSETGFTLQLESPQPQETRFTWQATQVGETPLQQQ